MIEALSYQLDSMGIYQEVYLEDGRFYPRLKAELNDFLNIWLKNLIDQGFCNKYFFFLWYIKYKFLLKYRDKKAEYLFYTLRRKAIPQI